MSHSYSYFQSFDGRRMRYGFWPRRHEKPGANAPTVLLLQGRASFMEKFETIIAGLNQRGFDVWSFDWRGQGLSARQVKNRQKGYIDSYETYLKDLDHFLKQKVLVRDMGPFIVLSQSMGAHLALRYMADYGSCFDKGILMAPMLDLNTGGYSQSFARWISKMAVKVGLGSVFVLGQGSYDPRREPFEGNMLTHDQATFLAHRSFMRQNPLLAVGGVTYGWAHATFESIDHLNTPLHMGKIDTPLLILVAGQESVVNNSRLNAIVEWLPKAEMKVYPQARHQMLSETPRILEAFWRDFDQFTQGPVAQKREILSIGPKVPVSVKTSKERIFPSLPSDYGEPVAPPLS